ncbi:aldose 1-epimerase family protein [Paenibacillus sp. KQZ6P-2]|uniref:Aldose 1-epimerase family protein n=1 Tax=Paenibacillus mangrovi TaxID=2931978 RepID=A0A9X1WVG9_9BACL|nr:DUF4432 family protein [Paenibacillus mangrovi]MCJ8014650.1 aldose 1-epimerase family protein [Paenibacillus mangrovi]
MIWTHHMMNGHNAWTGQTSAMQVTLLPELGSKMVSLKNRLTGREWLSQSEGPLGNLGYGSSFKGSDGSGWDEMFPTINVCRYPEFPWLDTTLPDHGEVWSISWQAEAIENKLECNVHGVRLPYQLRKTYSFPTEDRLRIDYAVTNLSSFPFSFLWAAHPLFQIEEGMEIIVPEGLSQIAVSYSENGRLGQTGELRPWPQPLGDNPEIRLDRTGGKQEKTAEKFYFTGDLPEGRASIYDPKKQEGLSFAFPKEKVPYLSVWANYGGYQGQYHLALEPATGFLDDLAYAMERKSVATVEAGETYDWHLEVSWIGHEKA